MIATGIAQEGGGGGGGGGEKGGHGKLVTHVIAPGGHLPPFVWEASTKMMSSEAAKHLATDGVVPKGVNVGFKGSRRVLDESDHLNGLFYELVQIIRTGGKTVYKPVEQLGVTAEAMKSFSNKLNREVHALIDNLEPLVLESVPVGTDVDGSTICAPFALLKKTNPRIIDAVFSAVAHPPKTTWRFLKKYSGLVSPGSCKFQTALEQVPMDDGAQLFPLQVMLANSSSWNMQFFEVSPGVTKFTLGTGSVTGKSGRTYTHPTLEVRVPALDKNSRWATPEEIAAVQQFLKTSSPVKTKKTTAKKPSNSNVPLMVKIRNTFDRLTSTTSRKTWQDLAEQNAVKTFQPCFDFILAAFEAIAEARGNLGTSKMTGTDMDLIVTQTVLRFGNIVVRKPNLADIAAYTKAMTEFEAGSGHSAPEQAATAATATTTAPPVTSLGLQFKFAIWRRIERVILPAFYACMSDKLVNPRDIAWSVSRRLAVSHPKPVVTVNRVASGALTPKQAAIMDYAREHLQLNDLSATLVDEDTAQQAAADSDSVVFINLGTRSGPDVRDLTTGPATVKCYVGAEETDTSFLSLLSSSGPVHTGRTCRTGACTTVKFKSTAGTLGASIVGDVTQTTDEKDLSEKQLAQHRVCMAFLKRRLYTKRLPWHEGFIRASNAKPTDNVEKIFGRHRHTAKFCMTLAGFQAFVEQFPHIRVSVGVSHGWYGFAAATNHPELFQTPVHVCRMTGYLTEPEQVRTASASESESAAETAPKYKYNLFNLDQITRSSPYVPVQSILACDGKVLIVPPGVCPTPTEVGFVGDTTLITPRLSEVFGATGLCSDLKHRLKISGMPSGPLASAQAFQASEKNWVAGFAFKMSPSKKTWAWYGAPRLEFTDGVTVCYAKLMPDAFDC